MQRKESSGVHGRVGLVLGRPKQQGLGHMVQGVSGVMFWLQLGCQVLENGAPARAVCSMADMASRGYGVHLLYPRITSFPASTSQSEARSLHLGALTYTLCR